MKNTFFLLLFLISSIGFSQNIFKKEIQLRKSNKIKETSFYVKYPKGEKYLKKIEFYDRNGLLVELKKFDEKGNAEKRLTFEYPNDQTRILTEYDRNDSLVTSYNQKFDSSNILEPNKRKSDSKKFKYKYNKEGDLKEVWRLDLKKPLLQTENFYNEQNRLIKQRLLIFEMFPQKYYYLTIEYELDENGNILEINYIENGKKNITETLEHKKYST